MKLSLGTIFAGFKNRIGGLEPKPVETLSKSEPATNAQVEPPTNFESNESKMIFDFGLENRAPERITIEVLKQLIRENPERMAYAFQGAILGFYFVDSGELRG